jgi:hypothetical protein
MQLRWPLLLLVSVFGCHASVNRPVDQPLTVSDLPEPPQQVAGWEPHSICISPEFASATKSLFEQGLADPRGCDYREIVIHIGEVRGGDGGNTKTHGWVLPTTTNSNQTFAVCWNGLVYPVVSVGRQMNLQADMKALVNSAVTNSWRMRMALYGRAFSEKLAVDQDSLLPLKACLLFRLGEDDLATNVWNACSVSLENSGGQQQGKDPYLMLAEDWAWSLFDRTICAHMRSDVPLALVSARKLTAIQPKIEAEAARRGFPHPRSYGDGIQEPKEQPYVPFLGQLPQLLADLERRAREPKVKSMLELGLTNFSSPSDRIAVLIDDLDLVKARQMAQPGWVVPQIDPIVQALIKEGNPTVEHLLKCWENDKRLTCSVGFHRDFFRDRHVVPVSSAAKAALQEILQTQFQDAAEARAFWRRYRGLSQEDRWYQVLREETVGQEQSVQTMAAGGQPHAEKMMVFGRGQWMEAARMIVQPNNVAGVPASGFYSSKPLTPGENPKLRGESLHGKRGPSVTELLVKNANSIAEEADKLDQFQGVDAIHVGTELCGIINKWEKSAGAAPAQRLMGRAIALWPNGTTFIMSSGHDLARYIPRLTEIRVEAGDTNALDEYATWMKSADEEKVDQYAVEAFEPLWHNPTNRAILTVSEQLFNDTNSPWSKLPWKRSTFHNPLDSELVTLPAFHKLLARELDKKDVVGSMEYFRPDTISYNLKDFGGGTRGFPWPAGEQPPIGTKVEIRQCDWIAFSLSSAKQIPFFNPFAPLEKRDDAIRNAKMHLD